MIYMLAAGQSGLVKIGQTSDPVLRFAAIQASNHEVLTVLRTLQGGAPEESWLHRRFAARHVRAEWFEFTEEMLIVTPPLFGAGACLTAFGIPTPGEVERRFRDAGMTIATACGAAGISQSTFYRWKSGSGSIAVSTLLRLVDVVSKQKEAA